jgi:hypothetical protein
MKKIIALLFFAGIFASSVFAQEKSSKIEFEKTVMEYGTIAKGSEGTRVFKFKNTGTAPLIIMNAQGSCGCTVPTYSKEPIAPGTTGEIKVKYDTQRVGAFTKNVTVTTNAGAEPVVLKIQGTVTE